MKKRKEKRRKEKKREEKRPLNYIDCLSSAAIVLMPFIVVGALLFLNGYGIHFSMLVPGRGGIWNDEISWWMQADAMIEYGAPLGYYGYNGTHAPVGTWGAWGWAPILPYALFGKLFGWELHSMALANMTFLSIALAVFIVLTRPDRKQKLWMVFVYLCSVITVFFSCTTMSEGLHYSLGIILVAMLIWMERWTRDTRKTITAFDVALYCAISIFVCYAVLVYMIFTLVVPLFVWFFFRKTKVPLRSGICLAATGLTAATADHIVSLISAPYPTDTISNIFTTIKEDGLYQGVCYTLDTFFGNMATVDFPNMFGNDTSYFWFYLLYLALTGYTIYVLITVLRDARKAADTPCLLMAPYFLIGFLFGYCTLYTGFSATLRRGINTGLLMALFCLIFIESKQRRKTIAAILVTWVLFSSASTWNNLYSAVMDMKSNNFAYVDIVMAEKEKLGNLIQLSENSDPWANTFAMYESPSRIDYRFLTFPPGTGRNYMRWEGVNVDARYAIVGTGTENQEEIVQQLLDAGHVIISEDDYLIVLENVAKYPS